ncbi:porin family protein [Flavobacteriaceae bacterium SZ-1-7]|uniref:porin family protein n=1 Tax=Tamlana sedimenti TaxID=3134126 RepID=UPI0031208220
MKNLISFMSFCFASLLLSSCVGLHAGVNSSQDVSKVDYSPESAIAKKTFVTVESQTSASALQSFKNKTNRTGFYVGVFFTDLSLGDKFEVQPEINFLSIKDNLNQIQAPILAKYEVIDQLSVVAGPNFGFLLDAPTGIKSFNLGADAGAQYDITDNIAISARYNLGLSNLWENAPSGSSVKLNNIQVGLGYKF